MNTISKSTAPISHQTDTTKLVSLLALATGAVAMPQSGQADIIYSNMTANPVIVGYGGGGVDSFLFDLPGTAQFGFQRTQLMTVTYTASLPHTYQTVFAGDLGGPSDALGLIRGVAGGFAAPAPLDAVWTQGAGSFLNVAVGTAYDIFFNVGHTPLNGYEHQYLAWYFEDDTPGAPAGGDRYGWVEISLSIGNLPAGPNVTIWGYAYDDAGNKPTMGQAPVPEPSSAALTVVGALMLGARGLRKWRQNRETVSKS